MFKTSIFSMTIVRPAGAAPATIVDLSVGEVVPLRPHRSHALQENSDDYAIVAIMVMEGKLEKLMANEREFDPQLVGEAFKRIRPQSHDVTRELIIRHVNRHGYARPTASSVGAILLEMTREGRPVQPW